MPSTHVAAFKIAVAGQMYSTGSASATAEQKARIKNIALKPITLLYVIYSNQQLSTQPATRTLMSSKKRTKKLMQKLSDWLESYERVSACVEQHGSLLELLEAGGGICRLEGFLPGYVAEGILAVLQGLQGSEWKMTAAGDDYAANNISHEFLSTKSQLLEGVFRVFTLLLPDSLFTFSAAKYVQQGHIKPHDDRAYTQVCMEDGSIQLCSRNIAVIYYLTQDWTEADGGALIDHEAPGGPRTYVPKFNSLVSFTIPRWHQVTPVISERPRYSIFGWFLEPGKLYDLQLANSPPLQPQCQQQHADSIEAQLQRQQQGQRQQQAKKQLRGHGEKKKKKKLRQQQVEADADADDAEQEQQQQQQAEVLQPQPHPQVTQLQRTGLRQLDSPQQQQLKQRQQQLRCKAAAGTNVMTGAKAHSTAEAIQDAQGQHAGAGPAPAAKLQVAGTRKRGHKHKLAVERQPLKPSHIKKKGHKKLRQQQQQRHE